MKTYLKELLESTDSGSFSFIAEGWYGSVYKVYLDGKHYALKKFKPIMREDVVNQKVAVFDYEVLETLGHSKHYPTLQCYKENEWMLTDWIDGVPFRNVSNKELYFSQLHRAYRDAIEAGWFPDDVKGDNLMFINGQVMIIDVGSYLPIIPNIEYNIDDRVEFVIEHAHVYPSVRDKSPYNLKGNM
jgi:serine/threonine protein kinase